jgi:hypothetical protein
VLRQHNTRVEACRRLAFGELLEPIPPDRLRCGATSRRGHADAEHGGLKLLALVRSRSIEDLLRETKSLLAVAAL